jgi:hypothetical protein
VDVFVNEWMFLLRCGFFLMCEWCSNVSTYIYCMFCFVIVYSLYCIVTFMYIICPFVLCVLV